MSSTVACHREPIVHQPGGGEVLDVVGDRVRILADSKVTGGACVIFEDTTPAGMGPPLHRHGRDDEYFFVVEGTAVFQVDGKRSTVGAGGFAFVPRGTVHAFTNPGPTPLRMLIACTPGGLEGPFRATHTLCAEGRATPEAVTAAFKPFDLEIVGPPLGPA